MSSKKLVVAIDCDDVLIHTSEYSVNVYNTQYGTSVKLEDAHSSNNPAWQAGKGETLKRLIAIQQTDGYANLAPDTETIKTIKSLSQKYELHLVTARFNESKRVTYKMVDKYFKDCFTSINHVGDSSKGEVCKTFTSDVLIDDNLKHLVSARACGVPNLVWFGNYPWQKSTDKSIDSSFATRCTSWVEVGEFLEQLASQA